MAEWEERVQEIRIVSVMDCLADPSKIRIIAEPDRDLHEALPYLAALLPRAGYNHAAGILTLVQEGRMLNVYPRMVTLAKALDEDDALTVLEWLRRLINEAYARREEIVPCFTRRRSPRLLDVYLLLPRTNCKRCGEVTCIALAARLVFGGGRPADCPPLEDAAFARNRALLAEWLGGEEREIRSIPKEPFAGD